MPGKHSIKRKKADRAAYRHAAEVVDARTLRAHLLTLDALAKGSSAGGRYIALCGEDVVPASLGEPGRERCHRVSLTGRWRFHPRDRRQEP